MNDSKISVRYAKALFLSAKEEKILDKVRNDMEEVRRISTMPEFQYLLVSPIIKESQKLKALDNIFKKSFHAKSLALLTMAVKNGREIYIPAIARNYIDQYKEFTGVRTATFTSASSVDEKVKKEVEGIIKKALNSSIELKTSIDEELIGGFVIRVDDLQYDASVASNLKKIRKQLLK